MLYGKNKCNTTYHVDPYGSIDVEHIITHKILMVAKTNWRLKSYSRRILLDAKRESDCVSILILYLLDACKDWVLNFYNLNYNKIIHVHLLSALYARSPIRLVRSHQGSAKGPCRAACIQRPISTEANTNNSRQKYQFATVSTLAASACCKDSKRIRRRGTNAAVQPLLRDTTSPTSET